MKSLSDIKKTITAQKPRFLSNYPIKSIAIFGSFARNEQTDQSDIDIMVEFDGSIGLKFIDFANELESLLGLKVDLVSRKGIKPVYFESIKKDLVYV